jgi:hypothetical protein
MENRRTISQHNNNMHINGQNFSRAKPKKIFRGSSQEGTTFLKKYTPTSEQENRMKTILSNPTSPTNALASNLQPLRLQSDRYEYNNSHNLVLSGSSEVYGHMSGSVTP